VNLYRVAKLLEHGVDMELQWAGLLTGLLELDEERLTARDEEHSIGVASVAWSGELHVHHSKHVVNLQARQTLDA